MRVVHDLAQVHPASRSYVTIGAFDGVHRGHQQFIAAMVEAAHSTKNTAIALTFDPHPALILGYPPPPLLTTAKERAEYLAALGLDVLLVLPFTPATARTLAVDFIDALNHRLHLSELWGGSDFALGYRREGNVSFLQRLGAERGFTMRIVEPLVWEGTLVSSSRIRTALKAGDIDQATGCLGRPYRLVGVIVQGRGVGRRIGMGTANLSPPPERLIPAGGVYACMAHTEHLGTHPAVVNIGTRPTFAGETLTVEAHLLDFDNDIYDQTLALDFIARLRDERPFPTPDALVTQIQNDIAQARDRLGVVSCSNR
ncbi:MAG: bifunctional riboflavin kinase/FAD synthetase [Anaerolineae bacterium]